MHVRETLYKGIQFRSRLEARWAVFFDALGLRWEYEPEGYRMDDGTCYLPDFYVHDIKGHVGKTPYGDGIFIEVKGELTDADRNKLNRFQYPIYVVGNFPKSSNPWTDVTIEFERHPHYMFSEYTVDGTEEDLWFAKEGSQVYLLRFGETQKNPNLDFCIKARDAAVNKKFEYQSIKSEFGKRAEHNRPWVFPVDEAPIFDSIFGDAFKKMKPPKWGGDRIKIRIPRETFKAMFLSVPGIKEYELGERIHFNETEDIPVVSSLVSSYDKDRECIAVQYHHMEEGEELFHDYFEYREILYIPLEGETSKEKEENFSRIDRAVKIALKWIKKEMDNYPINDEVRKALDQEEDNVREEIRLELNRERLAKEDEALFVSMNNPNSVAELIEIMKEELDNPENRLKYLDFLSDFKLADGISEEDKFGPGEFIIDRKGDILLMRMRRTYKGTTNSGRYFNKFDGRVLFVLDSSSLYAEDQFKHALCREELKGEFFKLMDISMNRMKNK